MMDSRGHHFYASLFSLWLIKMFHIKSYLIKGINEKILLCMKGTCSFTKFNLCQNFVVDQTKFCKELCTYIRFSILCTLQYSKTSNYSLDSILWALIKC